MEETAGLPSVGRGSPYISSPKSGGASPKSGKSKHISTMKSLGLLHDLKEYISKVENTAAEQKRELDRVKGEKREIERAVHKIEALGGVGSSQDFAASTMSDMPPKLRAVFEENKVLRDRVKKMREGSMSLETELTRRNHQIVVMEDSLNVLKQRLQSCSRSPKQAQVDGALQASLGASERRVKELEHDVSVLQKKVAVDAKLAKQAAAAAVREQESLHRQLIVQTADMEDKDRQTRALMLDARRMHKLLPPSKQVLFPGFALGASWEGLCAEFAGIDDESVKHTDDEPASGGVHVMLVVVNGDDHTQASNGSAGNPALSDAVMEQQPESSSTYMHALATPASNGAVHGSSHLGQDSEATAALASTSSPDMVGSDGSRRLEATNKHASGSPGDEHQASAGPAENPEYSTGGQIAESAAQLRPDQCPDQAEVNTEHAEQLSAGEQDIQAVNDSIVSPAQQPPANTNDEQQETVDIVDREQPAAAEADEPSAAEAEQMSTAEEVGDAHAPAAECADTSATEAEADVAAE